MEKFRNIYRIPSARASWWDYGWTGAHFITICTKNREHLFGEISNGIMHLSHLGVLADILWHERPHHFNNVELGAFVVMPNHIHGILILTKNNNDDDDDNDNDNGYDENDDDDNDDNDNGHDENDDDDVETRHALSLQTSANDKTRVNDKTDPMKNSIVQQRFQNQGKNTISAIIASYKSAVTKHSNRLGLENGWQSRFHDHIIRNIAEYRRIHHYIENNPLQWKKDRFY